MRRTSAVARDGTAPAVLGHRHGASRQHTAGGDLLDKCVGQELADRLLGETALVTLRRVNNAVVALRGGGPQYNRAMQSPERASGRRPGSSPLTRLVSPTR
jgi:hypothetical protein